MALMSKGAALQGMLLRRTRGAAGCGQGLLPAGHRHTLLEQQTLPHQLPSAARHLAEGWACPTSPPDGQP